MSRRTTKAESKLITAAAIIGIPAFLVVKLFESVGWVIPTIAIISAIVLLIFLRHQKKLKRIAYLRGKYRDEDVVQKIFHGYFWHGQTEEQLHDSLGPPVEVDSKILKTKTKEIWKYRHQGANRYGLRITVENGYVAGWDDKA